MMQHISRMKGNGMRHLRNHKHTNITSNKSQKSAPQLQVEHPILAVMKLGGWELNGSVFRRKSNETEITPWGWKSWNYCICSQCTDAGGRWHGWRADRFVRYPFQSRLIDRYYAPIHLSVPALASIIRQAQQDTTTLNKVAFPHLLHQTWSSHQLPDVFETWSRSWLLQNPSWQYRLWNDTESRQFISDQYSWFLPFYDEYNVIIKRVDAMRIFWMYHFGGVYADLDVVCLRSFEQLLKVHQDVDVLLGSLDVSGVSVEERVPNALIISKPRAQFWLFAMAELVRRVNCANPEFDTGPKLLTSLVRAYGNAQRVRVLNASYFFPINWGNAKWTKIKHEDRKKSRFAYNDSFAFTVTYWTHTWKTWKRH